MQENNRRNSNFIPKRWVKIWKFEKNVVSLQPIWKRRYKDLRNYEGEVDKFSG